MGTLSELEQKIMGAASQPREPFQGELAGRLQTAYEQRRPIEAPRRFHRLTLRTAVILAAVLTVGFGAVIAMNTYFQRFVTHDPGLKAIYEQGLGHEIGLSQTIDDFTVTLEWAYADGNRLILAYVIAGVPGSPYTNLTNDVYSLRLRDTGQEIPLYQSMNALIDQQGEAVGWGAPSEIIPIADRSLSISTYDLSAVETDDRSTLDLRLEVDAYGVTIQKRTQMPIEAFNDMKEGPDAHFFFDFSVALVDDQRILDTPLTATDQGITLTLRRVSVSPSQTRILLCLPPPDPARQWTAIQVLKTEGGNVPGGGGVKSYMDDGLACNDYTYLAGMYDYTGIWQVEVTELIGFGSGGGNDQQRIPGSWIFEFLVPEG